MCECVGLSLPVYMLVHRLMLVLQDTIFHIAAHINMLPGTEGTFSPAVSLLSCFTYNF